MNYLEFRGLLAEAEKMATERGMDVDACTITIYTGANDTPTAVELTLIHVVRVSRKPPKN